jgi:hypothetical protein
MINNKKNFFAGLFLLLIIPLMLFVNFYIFSGLYSGDLPNNKLIKDYRHKVQMNKLGMTCLELDSPDAMLILSRCYQHEKLFVAANSWLRFAAEKKKFPPAMLLLSMNCSKKSEAAFWYNEAIRIDVRLGSRKFQQALENAVNEQVRRIYEK